MGGVSFIFLWFSLHLDGTFGTAAQPFATKSENEANTQDGSAGMERIWVLEDWTQSLNNHPRSLQQQKLRLTFPVCILFSFSNKKSILISIVMYPDIKPHFLDFLINGSYVAFALPFFTFLLPGMWARWLEQWQSLCDHEANLRIQIVY